jgi:trk system potassium uptake protein TrkH
MFFAESPGPTEEKVTPRITQTAKALWLVYCVLTLVEIACLILAGMPAFDAVCNSFSTMAAGGFSPNPQSILGYNNPTITWVITGFMFLAGSNFAWQYQTVARRRLAALIKREEFKGYTIIILTVSLLLAVDLAFYDNGNWLASIRESLFQIISIVTTTGFSSSDFALWSIAAQTLIFSVMLVGGCAGSAGGGIKVIRVILGAKYMRREIIQLVHPRAVMPIKIDGKTVPDTIQFQVLAFLLFYIVLMTISAYAVTIIEGSASIGLVGTAATIGNIGPGFGEIGPMGTYGHLSWATKIIFIVNMIVGRLELIPFLAMLHPDFWRLKK